jgi:hypothetical protein
MVTKNRGVVIGEMADLWLNKKDRLLAVSLGICGASLRDFS